MSSNPTIVKYNSWNVKDTKFSALKLNKNGITQTAYVNYEGNRLFLQTPLMNLPFGLSDNAKFAKEGEVKHLLEPSFYGMKGHKDGNNENLRVFCDKMKEFDNLVVKTALKEKWMDDDEEGLDEKGLRRLFYPCIRDPNNKKKVKGAKKTDSKDYPPTMRWKLQLKRGVSSDTPIFDCEFYDGERNPVTVDRITPGSKVRGLIECLGAQVVSGKLSVSWRVVQVVIFSGASQRPSGFAFIPDSDDENSDDEGQTQQTNESPKGRKMITEDSDDESEEESAPAPKRNSSNTNQKKKAESDEESDNEKSDNEKSDSDDEPVPPKKGKKEEKKPEKKQKKQDPKSDEESEEEAPKEKKKGKKGKK